VWQEHYKKSSHSPQQLEAMTWSPFVDGRRGCTELMANPASPLPGFLHNTIIQRWARASSEDVNMVMRLH